MLLSLLMVLTPWNEYPLVRLQMATLNIKTVDGKGTFEDVIADVPPEIQDIAQATRELLRQF